MKLNVLAIAEADMLMAMAWYDAQYPGLGNSFLEQVDVTFAGILKHPELYQVLFGTIRRAVLHRFPYSVLYRVRDPFIDILGVLPSRSDPAMIRSRIDPYTDMQ